MPKARPIDLKRLNIQEHITNKKIKDETTFVYTPNKNFYLLDGIEIATALFDSMFPTLIVNTNPKGKNKDSRSNYY